MFDSPDFQTRVAARLTDTTWCSGTPTLDDAIAHACGHRGMPWQEHMATYSQHADARIMRDNIFSSESKRLEAEYTAELESWDWEALAREARSNAEPDEDGDSLIGRVYLGSVLSLAPSGKYYMPWCSNQTAADEMRDRAYFDALDVAADAHGGWIEQGEGDPLDTFFCLSFDAEEC